MAPQCRNRPVQFCSIRPQDFQQSLKSMVVFEIRLTGSYRIQTVEQITGKPSRVIRNNALQEFKGTLGKPIVLSRLMNGTHHSIRKL